MENGKRIVLEAAEGITFRVQEGEEEIVINAVMENIKSSKSKYNYRKPYIPEGYQHLYGTWTEGFTIQNLNDGSEFVWVPAGWLDADATLDGEHFDEKFGRMNWHNSDFSDDGYHEEVNQELVESVKKYGGFYFPTCHASKENGKLVFKKGNMPWVNINYHDAEALAANYARGSKDVKSCITSGAAFDSVLRWIIKSKAKTLEEVVKDSTSWGNYWNTTSSPRKVMTTGSSEKWCACNIYDIAGNVGEWTSEQYENSRRVLRGGDYSYVDFSWPAASRNGNGPFSIYSSTSFRAVLYLK